PEQRVEADGQTHYARAYIQYTGLYWVKFEFPSGWPGTKNQFSRPATNGGGGGGSSIPVPVIEEK
ncbi:MAG TPA: hypothetical protein VK675_02145, partial [Candidatus Paceibacterota bacterium]|nr:hypothetical protein [Candidatus Paceibacterota bacterium]